LLFPLPLPFMASIFCPPMQVWFGCAGCVLCAFGEFSPAEFADLLPAAPLAAGAAFPAAPPVAVPAANAIPLPKLNRAVKATARSMDEVLIVSSG
jgi:hypothetical protein